MTTATTGIRCITRDSDGECSAYLQRERRGEDPALSCPRCGEVYAPEDWPMLAALQQFITEPAPVILRVDPTVRAHLAAVLDGLRQGNERGGPAQPVRAILADAAERGAR